MSNFISINNVTKSFGDKQVLKGVSLELRKGEIISLLGANGAGKTTLSSIIATLKPATTGDVLFKGQSIYRDIPAYRQHIGYCPQKPNLNNDITLYENLELAGLYFGMSRVDIGPRIVQLAEKLHLTKYLHAYSDSLSGGYKQRFVIARSLMHRPELVILDEPTVALDPHIRRQLWEYILALKADGTTVLLTTHYIDEAEYLSDRVCVLDQGRIRLIDTPQNLMASFEKKSLEDVFLHLMQDEEEGA